AVMRAAADHLTPCIMELSGCDAVVVDASADLDLAARSIAFGLTFNGGATCIGPRRVLIPKDLQSDLISRLRDQIKDAAMPLHPVAVDGFIKTVSRSLSEGANLSIGTFDPEAVRTDCCTGALVLSEVDSSMATASADVFGPVLSIMPVEDLDQAVSIVNDCPYGLAASVFGRASEIQTIANQLRVGHVSLNDIIVPTADPRVTFGGHRRSGFGVTRGREGLLAMTRPRVISRRRGPLRMHLRPRREGDTEMLTKAAKWMSP
ncbi:MAG: aldehyde dehydrogenase family protein, partial [Planctomycetota bacterium]